MNNIKKELLAVCGNMADWTVDLQLSNAIEQRPSREAGSRAASEEMPRVLGEQKTHDRVHRRPPLNSVRSQTGLCC
jgi:hypothetical protein